MNAVRIRVGPAIVRMTPSSCSTRRNSRSRRSSECRRINARAHRLRRAGPGHATPLGGNGTDNFWIEHNYASCGDWSAVDSPTSDAGCSAVIGFYGDFGPIQNITIHRNFLASSFKLSSGDDRQAGYCLNPGYYPGKPYPAPENITVTDNVFARGTSNKCGVFGPTNSINAVGSPNGNVWDLNRFEDGEPILRVEE